MMRKIFGGAMAFSMVGAVVLGGVLAWSNANSFTSSAQVGRLSFSLGAVHNNDRIGPDDNIFRITDNVTITNTGGATGFDLIFDTGHVDILDVDSPNTPGGTSDQANCGVTNFTGAVLDQTGGTALLAQTNDPQLMSGFVAVQLAVHAGAPAACQSDIVSYRVVINMKTKSGN